MSDSNIKSCFIVSPLKEEGSETRKNADFLTDKLLKPIFDERKIEFKRADLMNHNGKIDDVIIRELERADLVISDITGHNPNVFFEIGIRQNTQKEQILVAKKGTEIPFDIASINIIFYDKSFEGGQSFQEKIKDILDKLETEVVTDSESEFAKVENLSIEKILDLGIDTNNRIKRLQEKSEVPITKYEAKINNLLKENKVLKDENTRLSYDIRRFFRDLDSNKLTSNKPLENPYEYLSRIKEQEISDWEEDRIEQQGIEQQRMEEQWEEERISQMLFENDNKTSE